MAGDSLSDGGLLPDLAVWVDERRLTLSAGHYSRLGVGRDYEVQLPSGLPLGWWASIRHAGYWVVIPESGTQLWLDGVPMLGERGTPLNERPGEKQVRLRRDGVDTAIRVHAPPPTPQIMTPRPQITRPTPDDAKPSAPWEQVTQRLPSPDPTVRLSPVAPDRSPQDQALAVRDIAGFVQQMDRNGWPGGIGLGRSRLRPGARRGGVVVRRVLRSKGRTVDVSPGRDGRPARVAATTTVEELMTGADGVYPRPLWDEGWAVTQVGTFLMWRRQCKYDHGFVYAPLAGKTDLADASATPPPGIWENPGDLTPDQLALELTRALARLLG
jgi:hypothetical protein